MMTRVMGPAAVALVVLLAAAPAQAEHKKIHEAIVELERAKDHLGGERKHEQVEKAHKAVKDAIKDVKESEFQFGGRRVRLIERLEKLDKELEKNWVNSRKALDEALEDLEFADKH